MLLKILLLVISILVTVCLYIYCKPSPIQALYKAETARILKTSDLQPKILREADIATLPEPVRRYLHFCGMIGKPIPANCRMRYSNAKIKLRPDKDFMQITYEQYNSVMPPARIAFIDASFLGMPFQGRDLYREGKGNMKGMLLKSFTLFDVKNEEINHSGLVTFLSEALFLPSVCLQPYITWEQIDDSHVLARIDDNGITVQGVFTISDKGEMISFDTGDRYMDDGNGVPVKYPWRAAVGEYRDYNGRKIPGSVTAEWKLPAGRLIYFSGNLESIDYDCSNTK
ncbi:MAG: hypothetical protein LWX56_07540 [Ignavibacteria bacterium]|nr:hypothetical protein [Ignavibacteria bacterium]